MTDDQDQHKQMLSFFEECIIVFHARARFQKKRMPRILLSITVNFGCSSYNFPEMNLDFRDLKRKHFHKGLKHDINGHRNHNSLGRGTIAVSSLWASVADIRDDPGQNQYTKKGSKLKDWITPQVNFFQEWAKNVVAGRGRKERRRRWWRIEK